MQGSGQKYLGMKIACNSGLPNLAFPNLAFPNLALPKGYARATARILQDQKIVPDG